MSEKVITRFAPSPTGFMHVGGVRTALYAWLWAQKNDGVFILRIEDTDKEREVEGSIEHIMESLKWLGINWDEGPDVGGPHAPYIQSERLDIYKKYAEILIKKGYAYPDPFTEEEVEKFRQAAQVNKKPFLYREHRPENPPAWDGEKPLRFKIPEIKSFKWNDLVQGDLSAGPEALDDFILIKGDGFPTYNFAHIVDDIEMNVTHVVRGQEFISSTPKFLSVYEALGIKPPFFVTTPPILGEGGNKKLSKRDGAKDILDYKKEGYLPDAMINYLAFLGFNPGGEKEVYTSGELVEVFDLSKIQRSGAKWSDDKLDWFNKEHIKKLSDSEFIENAKACIGSDIMIIKKLSEKELKDLLFQFRDRINKFDDLNQLILGSVNTINSSIASVSTDNLKTIPSSSTSQKKNIIVSGPNDYLFPSKDPIISDVKLLIPKDLTNDAVAQYLKNVKELIEKNGWEKIIEKNDDSELWIYAGKEGRGKVLWPLRVALSGQQKSADPFEIMKAIGKDSVIRRIEKALEVLSFTSSK